MSNASCLELLPPRQPAQTAPSTSNRDLSTKTGSADRSDQGDTKFKTRLAKKLHALQKQATPVSAKSTKPAADPAKDASPGDQPPVDAVAEDAKALADPANVKTPVVGKPKPGTQSADDQEKSSVATTKSTKSATAASPPPDQAVVKKPVDHKPATSGSKTPAVDPTAVNLTSASNPSPATEQVAKPSDDDADPDVIDGIKPATSSPYGSGKVVVKASADGTAEVSGSSKTDAPAESAPTDDAADLVAATAQIDQPVVKADAPAPKADASDSFATALDAPGKSAVGLAPVKGNAAPDPTPQARFVEANQPKIVSGIQGQLMPHGGTMQIRLDPPELGPMQVSVHMKDGVMTASFETTSEHATRLLSHTLSQLKSGLEAAGMNVQKLQVQQSSKRDGESNSNGDSGNAPQEQQQQAQQEKQRREMVQRMWRKLAGGDPLDLMA